MTVLHIAATSPAAGKTCLAGAFLLRLLSEGRQAAYCKPVSSKPHADPDLAFMAAFLSGMDASAPSPGATAKPAPEPLDLAQLSGDMGKDRLQSAIENLARLENDYEVILSEWAIPIGAGGAINGFDANGVLSAGHFPVILLAGYDSSATPASQVAAIAETAQTLGNNLAAIVINNVLRYRRRQAEEEVAVQLQNQGLPVLGLIMEDREMLAVTVRQVAEHLNANWVQEPLASEVWIDRFLIGGNIMDSGPNYFGRYANQAVITRGGRPDIQLASLMCDTKCLVLTEGVEPTEYVRVEARKRGAALLLLEAGTLEVAESIGGLVEQANPYSERKLARFAALLEENLGSLTALTG